MSIPWIPHGYQERVVKLFLQQGAAGALLDPGLGKTSISLASISILKRMGYVKRCLLIAPLRPAYSVWPHEISKWENFSHLKYHILHGSGRNPWAVPDDTDIVIVNPEGLLWLLDINHPERLRALGCDMLIVDESTKFKDSQTKRFKLLRHALDSFKRRYILTGSIAPNGLLDLFGQIFVLDQGNALGQYITHYRRNYFHKVDDYNYALAPESFEKITERISPLVMELRAEDYLDMPEMVVSEVPVDLPPAAMERYKEMETNFITMIMDGHPLTAANAAVVGGKCRQIANGNVYYEEYDPDLPGQFVPTGERGVLHLHDEKLKALEDLLEELNGHPVLVLYEFQHDRDAILAKWPNTPYLGGGVSAKQADAHIEAFNNGRVPMLMGHPASMGHGLNLQGACRHVIWYGVTWNFEYYDQSNRRVYRQGQEGSHVFIYHIVARGTLDEKVLKVLARKERTQRDLLNALTAPEIEI